jgi:FtsP/CotA-like multicopper oxidase with cupredoxin domain
MMSSGECTEPANQPLALATIYYEHANTTAAPGNNSIAQVDNTAPCENDDLTKTTPAYPIAAGNPSTTIDMAVNVSINATGNLVWTINESAFRADYNNPILLLANKGNTSYPFNPNWNVYNVGTNTTIRVVVTNLSPTSHPWHLHGHEM